MNIPQTHSQPVWENAISRDDQVEAFCKVVAPLYSKKTVPTIWRICLFADRFFKHKQ